jgi:hypothetical protein
MTYNGGSDARSAPERIARQTREGEERLNHNFDRILNIWGMNVQQLVSLIVVSSKILILHMLYFSDEHANEELPELIPSSNISCDSIGEKILSVPMKRIVSFIVNKCLCPNLSE